MAQLDLKSLSRCLEYQFQRPTLLRRALTHRSAAIENNERFEFVGDSILGFVIADVLFHRFPSYSEGELSRLRSFLVRGDRLAEIAAKLDLGNYLFLGQGEMRSGGFRRPSILAGALEAIIAAVYFDGGIVASKEFILRLYKPLLEGFDLNHDLKDAKTKLQEYLQAQKKPLPQYNLIKVEGEEHQQIFYVACQLENNASIVGKGSNRRGAEQDAAMQALQQLKVTR